MARRSSLPAVGDATGPASNDGLPCSYDFPAAAGGLPCSASPPLHLGDPATSFPDDLGAYISPHQAQIQRQHGEQQRLEEADGVSLHPVRLLPRAAVTWEPTTAVDA